jgi:unsaturated chondroitin disaccharide hydrolase
VTADVRRGLALDDFSRPLGGWKHDRALKLDRTTAGGDPALALRPARAHEPAELTRSLPGSPAALSLDLGLAPGARIGLFGGGGPEPPVELRRTPTALVVSTGDRRLVLRRRADGRRLSSTQHVEAVLGRRLQLSIDGVAVDAPGRPGRSFALRAIKGRAVIANFIASPLSDRRALLLHRLAALHAFTPSGRAPLGVGSDGTMRFYGGWTRGFWPGALWQAADVTRGSDVFRRWALRATTLNFGEEHDDTHDLGFMYARSSVAAYERLCQPGAESPDAACDDLRRSGLDAADSLAALARTNEAAGMIPTRSATLCRGCADLDEADTIIDSMMNLSLLLWAARESPERAAYRDIAVRHAQEVARYLVRPDGSTAQAVHTRRADGAVVLIHTHQGVSDTSTWARGQSWAVYGFAQTALSTRSPELLDVAERTAGYIQQRDPLGLVPPYDYDAGPGAPTDTSAAVIAAAGLFRLEDACRRLRRCDDRGPRWGDLGERLLDSSLRSVRSRPPLGFFDGQVFSLGGVSPWDDSGEFIFGLDYGLEAISLADDR